MGYTTAVGPGRSESINSREAQITLALSLVVGALVGLVVVAFILLTGRLAARMYPAGGAAVRRVLIPVCGALITGVLLIRFFPEARGSGIPQTKFALFIGDGYISLRTVIGKFVCCSASLASGIALGREGPSVQMGAGIASVLGRAFGLSAVNVRNLVPVGCAAALAAAFNTPIAAVLFSLEEIMGDLHAAILGSVVISSAASWMVLHLFLGDEPLFHVPAYHLINPSEFIVYVVLGVVGGLGSVAFVKLLLVLRIWFRKLPRRTLWIQPAVGGLTVGLFGWFRPEVLGVGYDYVERVLGGDLILRSVIVLAVLKIVATAVCYSSGNAGGIFGPSLFIGAMLGGCVGGVAHLWFPSSTADAGAYALVGMGTAFAGIVRTPLTSVIMIFEMTRDYSIIVPLMISNLISFFVSYKLQPQPIYEALAHQEGVELPSIGDRELLGRLQVREGMLPISLEANSLIHDVIGSLGNDGPATLPVVSEGRLLGLVTRSELSTCPPGKFVKDAIPADVPNVTIYADQPLSLALEKMGANGVDALPVVSRSDRSKFVGTITLTQALRGFGVERP
jgi:CIC family chloride channel protein